MRGLPSIGHGHADVIGEVLLEVDSDAQSIEVPVFDVNRAELEAFAAAAAGGPDYPISHQQMVHGVAVTEAVLSSARSSRVETVA